MPGSGVGAGVDIGDEGTADDRAANVTHQDLEQEEWMPEEEGLTGGSASLPEEAPKPPPQPPPPAIEPVTAGERVGSVDVLRGVAVLGILAMNIYSFALPASAYTDPTSYGGFTGFNLATWIFTHLFFEQKFMTIFSMLFGGGLVLMGMRADARRRRFLGVYYRRVLWLVFFGLLHAYLLWVGDILYHYGVCGLLLYPFRRKSPKTLLMIGFAGVLLAALLSFGMGLFIGVMRDTAVEAEALVMEGEPLSDFQEAMQEAWAGMTAQLAPTAEEIDAQLAIYRGGYPGILRDRIPQAFMMQTLLLLLSALWQVTGLMLLGMGLMKLGVFAAQRSTRFYTRCVALGYGIGLPIVAVGTVDLYRTDFDFVHAFKIGFQFNHFGSVLVALGHIGVVMLACKSDAFPRARVRLAAIGRMAFTNYLMQSVICTTIFYGYGFGLFGHVARFPLMGFVAAIWVLQLFASPIWLRHFRFGPAEWLWRSLTYWRRQPMRLARDGLGQVR